MMLSCDGRCRMVAAMIGRYRWGRAGNLAPKPGHRLRHSLAAQYRWCRDGD